MKRRAKAVTKEKVAIAERWHRAIWGEQGAPANANELIASREWVDIGHERQGLTPFLLFVQPRPEEWRRTQPDGWYACFIGGPCGPFESREEAKAVIEEKIQKFAVLDRG